ncbi:MAG TPA: HD domain-containing protein [Prolixibacteraceae bacterium]|nr:HD domain-containing protein [Prolixibacteraceae bacterium]
MSKSSINKRKIINDPVLGFINLQSDLIFDLIEHPFFQRLRRIRQLGLSNLVYPGANHTRFEHALGSLHLMRTAIDALRNKGVEITSEEADAASVAILLHDIGHGPFSHALEYSLVKGIPHEKMSLLLIEQLNEEFEGKLQMAIRIFKNEYPKKFLHQLVAGQLDVDRLDYLRRDSFYSGVIEGTIGSDRIIKMMHIKDDHLVVDKKGIYSVEKFLIARRLMYWQVYLHKTVIAAEHMLIHILKRAKELVHQGEELFAPPALLWLLKNTIEPGDLANRQLSGIITNHFVQLDDSDILSSIKIWCQHPDAVLSILSQSIIHRRLFRIILSEKPFPAPQIEKLKQAARLVYSVDERDLDYFVFTGEITNSAYEPGEENILIAFQNNETCDLRDASDIDLGALSKKVKKHFLCYPKDLDIN